MVTIFGIQFAPLNVPLSRRLQTFFVMIYVLCMTYFLSAVATLSLLFIILFTNYYWIPLIYMTFLYFFEWNSAHCGGRRFEWVRRGKILNYVRDYFPITLVKTTELDPTKRYLIGSHPHGILAFGAFVNFATEATGFSSLFPGIVPHVLILPGNFYMTVFRTLCLAFGARDCRRETVTRLMTIEEPGTSAVIIFGGAEEVLYSSPETYRLVLLRRKGFIRMAFETGAHLIPSFTFGENNLYNQLSNPPGSKLRRVQDSFKSIFGFAPVFFYGRGIFNYTFGFMPFRKKVATVIGAPIEVSKISEPTTEDVDNLHKVYLTALRNLFDEHKHNYGISEETQLKFL